MQEASVNTILINQDQKELEELENRLKTYEHITINNKIIHPQEVAHIASNQPPDLVFLDVPMTHKDGFEIIESLQFLNPYIKVIITAFESRYAIKAIRHGAFDFLIKPIHNQELNLVMSRLKKINGYYFSELNGWACHKKFKFYTQHGIILLNADSIVHVEAQSNYSAMHLDLINHEIVSMNIGRLEQLLPSPPFFRISRSSIINTQYIHKINKKNKYCILIKNGQLYKLSIARKKIKELEEKL